MVNSSDRLDGVFSALADPTRREILERLARRQLTVGELAAGFSMSLPAISKHVKVLERSGLLKRRIDGRVHRCRLGPRPLEAASAWLSRQERFWNAALQNLDDYLDATS